MTYSFKKFESTKGRYENRITVTGSRSFGFPTKFYKDNKLSKYKYVVIFYDLDIPSVGFLFNNNDDEQHKFSLIKSTQGYGASVVATSFFKKHDLDPQKFKGRYDWKKVKTEFGTLFVIDLDKGQNSPAPEKASSA